MPIISIRDNMPAIDVRDNVVWAHDPETGPIIDALGEAEVEAIYENAREEFWQDASVCAEGFGFLPEQVYSAGRSGGWLALGGTDFLDYSEEESGPSPFYIAHPGLDEDGCEDSYVMSAIRQRENFLFFAEEIENIINMAQRNFRISLGDAMQELEERRAEAIVLGYN